MHTAETFQRQPFDTCLLLYWLAAYAEELAVMEMAVVWPLEGRPELRGIDTDASTFNGVSGREAETRKIRREAQGVDDGDRRP